MPSTLSRQQRWQCPHSDPPDCRARSQNLIKHTNMSCSRAAPFAIRAAIALSCSASEWPETTTTRDLVVKASRRAMRVSIERIRPAFAKNLHGAHRALHRTIGRQWRDEGAGLHDLPRLRRLSAPRCSFPQALSTAAPVAKRDEFKSGHRTCLRV